jgi:hypothetical protein
MVMFGWLDLDARLVKIMVKVYVQQKNIYKIFDSCVVAQKLRFKFNFLVNSII